MLCWKLAKKYTNMEKKIKKKDIWKKFHSLQKSVNFWTKQTLSVLDHKYTKKTNNASFQ